MRRQKTNSEINIKDFKKRLRDLIDKKYGSIGVFLKSEEAKEAGLGYADRPYIYDSCAISMEKLNKISKILGGGEIKKKTFITKEVKYFIV